MDKKRTAARHGLHGHPLVATYRPNCTHITMERVHGDMVCNNCGEPPSMGWLYVCRQDVDFPVGLTDTSHKALESLDPDAHLASLIGVTSLDEPLAHHEPIPNDLVTRTRKPKEPQGVTAELEALGFSQSVIEEAERGGYDVHQLAKLKKQKRLVNRVIEAKLFNEAVISQTSGEQRRRSHQHHRRNTSTSSKNKPDGRPKELEEARVAIEASQNSSSQSLPMLNATATAFASKPQLPSSGIVNRRSSLKRVSASPPCSQKSCHACRSFFQDRIYMSLEAVLAGEVAPLTLEQASALPVKDAKILRNIKIPGASRPAPSEITTVTDSDATNITDSSERHGLRRLAHKVFHKRHHRTGSSETLSETSSTRSKERVDGRGRRERSASPEPSEPRTLHPGDQPTSAKAAKQSQKSRLSVEQDTGMSGKAAPPQLIDEDIKPSIETRDSREARARAGFQRAYRFTRDFFGKSTGTSRGEAITRMMLEDISSSKSERNKSISDGTSDVSTEVEVEGGVALTEEAVENQTPDIALTEEVLESPAAGLITQV